MYTMTSSGKLFSTGSVVSRPCRLHGITVLGDGVSECGVQVYDGANTNKMLAESFVTATDRSRSWISEIGVECSNGIHIELINSAEVIVLYSLL
jgi:hypothetical protein